MISAKHFLNYAIYIYDNLQNVSADNLETKYRSIIHCAYYAVYHYSKEILIQEELTANINYVKHDIIATLLANYQGSNQTLQNARERFKKLKILRSVSDYKLSNTVEMHDVQWAIKSAQYIFQS